MFAAPAIAFALLPSVVGAGRAPNGIALTAAIMALCALAGVLIQRLGRRLDAAASGYRGTTIGLLVAAAGFALAALTAHERATWMLRPCALVFGSAYGLCLVAGLVEVERLAGSRGVAALNAACYVLTYFGFAAPYLLALGAQRASYSAMLAATAALALGTVLLVSRGGKRAGANARRGEPERI